MLETDVINCIRDTIAAELNPRNQHVRDAVRAAQNQLAARGLARSGQELHERARIGSDELAVRAAIIWTTIRRCHGAFAPAVSEQLGDDLRQQVAEHISAQTTVVLGYVDLQNLAQMFPANSRGHIRDVLTIQRNELIAKFNNEVRFYVQAVRRSPEAANQGRGQTINIHGNVGALQTGDFAAAHIHLDLARGAEFVRALEQLQAAISQSAEMTAEQRAESAEVVSDLITAASVPKPNGSKLAGLLSGLAVTVQTVASARGAWDLVRDAARLMGIPLP